MTGTQTLVPPKALLKMWIGKYASHTLVVIYFKLIYKVLGINGIFVCSVEECGYLNSQNNGQLAAGYDLSGLFRGINDAEPALARTAALGVYVFLKVSLSHQADGRQRPCRCSHSRADCHRYGRAVRC